MTSWLTNEATTFVPGEVKDTGNTTGSITLNQNQFTELEFALQATSNVVKGVNYCFKLVSASGTSISTYSAYAEMEIYLACDVNLANHAAGQETNAFSGQHSVTGAELFAFQLANTIASGVSVDQVQFQLSGVSGLSQGDFSNLKIYVDANSDGTIGAGETTTVGGNGVDNIEVSTLTFGTDFDLASGVTVNYIHKGGCVAPRFPLEQHVRAPGLLPERDHDGLLPALTRLPRRD